MRLDHLLSKERKWSAEAALESGKAEGKSKVKLKTSLTGKMKRVTGVSQRILRSIVKRNLYLNKSFSLFIFQPSLCWLNAV